MMLKHQCAFTARSFRGGACDEMKRLCKAKYVTSLCVAEPLDGWWAKGVEGERGRPGRLEDATLCSSCSTCRGACCGAKKAEGKCLNSVATGTLQFRALIARGSLM